MLCLIELHDTPFFEILIGDAKSYDAWARDIAAGAWFGKEVFYQAPAYPYFVAVLYKVFGHDVEVVRVVQSVLGALACAFLVLAGRRFFSLRIGVTAGLLLALYPPAIFFDGIIQKASLAMCLTTLLLATLGELSTAARWRWSLLSGIVLGLLALTRENALIIVPIVALWISFLHQDKPRRVRAICTAAFLVGLAAVLVPVGLRNQAIGGKFLVTTSQFGPNFYIGNNPEADGTYRPLRQFRGQASFERRDAVELAEADVGEKLSPAQVSDYWFDKAKVYIRENPGQWLKLMVRKYLLVWNAAEIGDTECLEAFADSSRVLRLPGSLLHFGIIAPIAAIGIVATRRDWRRLSVLHAIVISLTVAVALFFIFARYRHPVVAVVILFAAAGVWRLLQAARHKEFPSLAGYATLVAVTAILVNTNRLPAGTNPKAFTYANLANAMVTRGRTDEAIDYHRKALALHPTLSPSHYGLGMALAGRGEFREAIEYLTLFANKHPDNFKTQYLLGIAYRQEGDPAKAAEHFARAAALEPTDANAHVNLGTALDQLGRTAEALEHYRLAVKHAPTNRAALYNLARILIQHNELIEAKEHLEALLNVAPDDPQAREMLDSINDYFDRRE